MMLEAELATTIPPNLTNRPLRWQQIGLGFRAGARTASGSGFDKSLHGRRGNQQQLRFWRFHLFDDGQLLRFPGIGSGLTFCDGVKRGKASRTQGGEVLRVGGYLSHKE